MGRRNWKLLSLVMVVMMLTSILPTGIFTYAAEDDNTLASLSYTYNNSTVTIPLVADDYNGALQENRYSVELPYITKTFTGSKLPTVAAVATDAGAAIVITQVSAFPGTAKIAVTSVSGLQRNYHVRFKFASGSITNVDQNISTVTSKVYPAYNDFQPMSLTDLRELYRDVNTLWETYCRALVDRGLSGTAAIGSTVEQSTSSKIPSETVPLLDAGKTGLYIQDYQSVLTPSPKPWANMWLATGVSTNSGATVLYSSPFFDGASWIAAGNDDKSTAYMTTAHDDAITFDISRSATVWVAMNNSTTFANFANNGWTRDASLTKKLYHGDGSAYGYFYYKHYNAGETVRIPTYGTSSSLPGRMYMPFVLWDAPGSGNTELASMNATVNGTPINIDIVPGQTTYSVALPAGGLPQLAVTLADTGAEYDITQATTFPGSAAIKVLSGQNSADYTINFTIEGMDDADLTALSYTPVGGSSIDIPLGDAPYVYNIDLANTTLPNQIPAVNYTLSSQEANAQVTNPAALPGATTILVTAQDGITTKTYTINWVVPGLAQTVLYAAPKTPDLGKSGMSMTYPSGNGYPTIPANYSGNVGPLTGTDASRLVTNYGGISTFTTRYDRNGLGGSMSYVYAKFDLSEINTNIVKATLKMDAKVLTGNTAYGLINTFPAVISITKVPETGWLTGTGTGDASFNTTTGDMNKVGWLSNKTDLNGPLTGTTSPESTLALADDSVTDKTIQKIALFTIPAGAHNTYNSYEVDLTEYLAERKAAGFTTATIRYQVVPYIYGPELFDGSGATTVTTSYTRNGDNGVRVELVTSEAAPTLASSNNKLEYITLGNGNSANIAKTMSFAKNTADQTFAITTSDLISGKINLNTYTSDASATVSINGSAASPSGRAVQLSPTFGTATAQVMVTAPNGDVFTYNLTFNITDYVMSTDSSLKSLSYTHSMLGKKTVATQAGVTTYNIELPYGISAEVPQISAEANNLFATIESITQATNVPGSASVVVKAESGTTSTYTINFTKLLTPPVPNYLPGTVTNVKTRYKNATTAQDTPVENAYYYPVQGSTVVPNTKYAVSTPQNPTPYATLDDVINATMSLDNPYFTDDKTTWVYGDRAIMPDTGNGSANTPYRNNTQYATVEGTSSLLVGDKVTKVLVSNTEKDFTLTIPDLYTFDIDKAATVYVASYTNSMEANYIANGWTKETGMKVNKATVVFPPVQGTDGMYYAVPNGVSPLTAIYSKHYLAGSSVSIPSRGVASANGILIYVIWDECNTNTTLSNLQVNGQSIAGFSPATTSYTIALPYGTTAVPTLTATSGFSGASVEIINPSVIPGTATINITAADTVATGSYTIDYIIETLPAPEVVADDLGNTIIGLDLATMEYAISTDNGETYGSYSSEPTGFGGALKVKVRFKATETSAASDDAILTFTTNAGDINNDGVINIYDVVMAAEIAVGYTNYTAEQIARANVNDKLNTTVDIGDVIMILERSMGNETIFPVEATQAPYIIIKLDDLRDTTVTGFGAIADIAEQEDIKVSFGVIGNSLEDDGLKQSYYDTIKGWAADGIEIWHHGYTHGLTEYNGSTYELQKDSFQKTVDLMAQKCDYTLHTFGSPYNNSDATTVQLMNSEFPQIKVSMLAADPNNEANQLELTTRCNIEVETGVLGFSYFVNNYNNTSSPYMVLQGHPANWTAKDITAFKNIISFLKSKGAIFVTPYEYYQTVQPAA